MKKKLLSALAVLGGAVSAFAEGNAFTFDTTAAQTAVSSIQTGLTTWATAVLPYLLGIVGAFLIFWLVKFAVRLIKGFTSASK